MRPVRDYVSFSAISLFQRCSLRYFFRYIAQLPEESVSASLVFGRSIHRAIEFHYSELLAGNGSPDRDTLLAEFNESWEETPPERINYPKTDTRDSLGSLADRMIDAFQQSDLAQPSGRVLGVEEELRSKIIDGVPDVLARLDLLVQDADGLTVTDFKTAKNAWSADQTTDSGEQLLLYSELVRQRFPGWPIRLEFIVFKKAKTVTVARHVVAMDSARLNRTKRIVQRVWRAIEAGNFFPSPSPMNCNTCPFRDPCRRWTG
jgi:RecB family exonuclease